MKIIKTITGITTEDAPNFLVSGIKSAITSNVGNIILVADGIILTKGDSQIKIPRSLLLGLANQADPNFGQ